MTVNRQHNLIRSGISRDPVNADDEDHYSTPPWATQALLSRETFAGSIWEPACGEGLMVKELVRHGHSVLATDLHDRGFGTPGVDFITAAGHGEEIPNVVTNPPYRLAEEFAHRALEVATRKVALFCRLAWLEGDGRGRRLFDVNPPARVWVMRHRVATSRGGGIRGRQGRGGAVAFAWYVWDRKAPTAWGDTRLAWVLDPERTSR